MAPNSSKAPLRRSQRGRNYAPGYVPGLSHTARGKPILTRPTRADLDCFATTDESDDDGDAPSLQFTSFFKSFTRQKSHAWNTARTGGVKGKGKASDPATFSVGDTVLVRSRTSMKPTVAVIVSIWETHAEVRKEDTVLEDDDQDDLKVRLHTFLTQSQLPTVRAVREYGQNEIYYTIDHSTFVAAYEIETTCLVASSAKDLPEGHSYFCHNAIDARKGVYYPLDWRKHHAQALKSTPEDSDAWNVQVKAIPARELKSRHTPELSESEAGGSSDEYEHEEGAGELDDDHELGVVDGGAEDDERGDGVDDDVDDVMKTPSKKKRSATASMQTPRKKSKVGRKRLTAPTPHSKAALRRRQKRGAKRQLASIRERATNLEEQFDTSHLPDDIFLRALHLLHVGSRPDALPCREDEFDDVLSRIVDLIEEGAGGCLYIAGVPGTGKTATVHAVIRELKRMAERNELSPFTYLEINGLKIPEPSAAYALLWETLSNHDVATEGHLSISTKEALKNLTRWFNGAGDNAAGHTCVVLMDELDQMVTAKQDVVYNFFDWPTQPGSRLVVIAVANTMDLPERTLAGKVRSRMGEERVIFSPYNVDQLRAIVNSRLEMATTGYGKPEDVMVADAIVLAAKRVAAISGDARRMLDISRRAVEIAYNKPVPRAARPEEANQVNREMQNSPTAAYIRGCSLHEKVMLVAAMKLIRRDGVAEFKWGDVTYQHKILLPTLSDSSFKPTTTELTMVLDSLLASRALIIEEGAAASRKAEGERRLILNLEEAEIARVLGEINDRWKSAVGG